MIHRSPLAALLFVLACDGEPPPVGSCEPRPHEDGICFALAYGVYPTSHAWCEQEHPDRPVPFACLETPPADSCAPFYGDGSKAYPDRYCCCDPQADPKCSFYEAPPCSGDCSPAPVPPRVDVR